MPHLGERKGPLVASKFLSFSSSLSGPLADRVKNCLRREQQETRVNSCPHFSLRGNRLPSSSLTPSPALVSVPCLSPFPSIWTAHPYTVAVGPVTFSSIRRSLKGLSWKKGRMKTSLYPHEEVLGESHPFPHASELPPKTVHLRPTLKSWRS